jgi:hypothetical protein
MYEGCAAQGRAKNFYLLLLFAAHLNYFFALVMPAIFTRGVGKTALAAILASY